VIIIEEKEGEMKYFPVVVFLLFFAFSLTAEEIVVDVAAPEYQLEHDRLAVRGGSYINPMGAPGVPCRKVTIALPPGAVVESVHHSGARQELGYALIEPAYPMVPLMDDNVFAGVMERYEQNRKLYYASDEPFPHELGALINSGGIRKYTVVDIACYHFGYRALSQRLLYAPSIRITIKYRMPAQGSDRELFWNLLKDDITFDNHAEALIHNWEQAKSWYHTDSPKRANGFYIITPTSLVSSVDSLIAYRQAQGYDVQVVTTEYIESNSPGDDFPQKLRNYLRANLADIAYVLLVGFSTDVRWRSLVPFNNDPNSPWNSYDYSPIPSDLYYAELTDHDTLSWNSDRDSYYGEVYDANIQPNGEDNPDYHADIHVGRIPFSNSSYIEDICIKMIAFDGNTDLSYKTGSLLAGALYYYANENYQGGQRNDGADYCEELMDDSVLDRSNATYLYEKGGLRPCQYSCTDSLTQTNMIAYWQSKGIMYECHHGHNDIYARKLWAWDDGDSVPESNEITWPTCLHSSNVYQLDNTHPATCVLRSCLCGNPDVSGLGSMLLYRGASSVISSSRICWMTHADAGGIPYHFFERLMRDTMTTSGIIGDAYDLARTDFMNMTMFWLPAYHYNLFGDPALRQYGRLAGIAETKDREAGIVNLALTATPNPFSTRVTITLLGAQEHRSTRAQAIHIYDIGGRLVRSLVPGDECSAALVWDGRDNAGSRVAPGVYFCVLKASERSAMQKVLLVR
jgi:hypothetical protein